MPAPNRIVDSAKQPAVENRELRCDAGAQLLGSDSATIASSGQSMTVRAAESRGEASHRQEIGRRQRFEFGENWTRFLAVVDEPRVQRAEDSLKSMLAVSDLRGRSFLDVGCGSGLFSLAARRLGATVVSFDFDPKSVACASELRRRYFPDDPAWVVKEGSVLDVGYLHQLGKFDIVYSWGVLHHTGAMWDALANVDVCVAAQGMLFVALYNDQGRSSKRWRAAKRAYVKLPRALRFLVMVPCFLRLWGPTTIRDLSRLRPGATWTAYRQDRGMSPFRDVVDWVGGLPFEVCKPEQIFDFYRQRGYELRRLRTCGGGHGCNEFVLARGSGPAGG